VPDWLPALVNAGRAFATIGAVELFWIMTAWPNGAGAITWAAISVILFAPRADEAYARAVNFMTGTGLAAVCAAIIIFAGLPNVPSFAGFSIVMALYLIPVGALMAQPWQASMFAPMAGNFVPLLSPANQMSYDTVQFYNAALAIVVGCSAAALSFRLLPPLSPALRSERLLALTLRDLRRLATAAVRRLQEDWEGRMYSRLEALPDQAEPLQRAQLVAALSAGTDIIHLRRIAFQLGLVSELDSARAPCAWKQRRRDRTADRARSASCLPQRGRPGHLPCAARARPGSCDLRRARPASRLFRRRGIRLNFVEIDLLGVYIAPISVMMVAAWLVTVILRRVADRFGVLAHVWHPALFVFALYIIVLSSIVLFIAR
jgi:uncharacterized membrane protein YccC